MLHLIFTAARELHSKPPELEAALATPHGDGAQNGAVTGSRCSSNGTRQGAPGDSSAVEAVANSGGQDSAAAGHGAALSRISSLAVPPVASNVVLQIECDTAHDTKVRVPYTLCMLESDVGKPCICESACVFGGLMQKVIGCLRSAVCLSIFLLILQLVLKIVANDGDWWVLPHDEDVCA